MQRTNGFSSEDLKTIEGSEHEQRQFKEFVVASKTFSAAEKAAIQVDTIDAFNAFWEQANVSKESFERSQEKGYGAWSKSYQEAAVVVHGFMKEFSPIIEIIKDFAAPYGGLAVGTISLLFLVAKNKNEIEERLASAILSIKDRLPGLQMYQHIYNSKHELDISLQTHIVSAYQGFIDFSIAATKYYKGGGPQRWLKAMGPAKSLLDKVNKVQEKIVQIRRLCEELLNKNVDEIKQLNIKQTERIQELDAQVKQLQREHDDNRLRGVQRLLKLDSYSEETQRKELDKYRHDVATDEQINAEYFEQMQGSELSAFKSKPPYQSFMTSSQASLLILSGYNNESIQVVDQCWVSPVAISLIEELGKDPRQPVYAYSILPPRGKLVFDVLPQILLQLLRRKAHVLRDKAQYDELCAELGELQEYDDDGGKRGKREDRYREEEKLAGLLKVAVRVVGFFAADEEVYVVVDRLDRCRDWKSVDQRMAMLKVLVGMVREARARLRVLTVVNGYSWPAEKFEDELGRGKGRVVLHKAVQSSRSS